MRSGAQILGLVSLMVAASTQVYAQNGPSGLKPAARTAQTAKIRGVVFDSLLRAPIKDATVTLLGRSETVTTDDQGRFSFDNVPVGEQTIGFEANELDSLGLGTMGTTVTLRADETARVTLGTPSLRTLWQRRCSTPLGSDSGIVWGTVRHAESNKLVGDAVASFSWFDMSSGLGKALLLRDIRKEVLTDDTGLFFACGVPTDVVITSAAIDTSTLRGKAASGFIEYAVGSRGLQRLDLVISPDMIAPSGAALKTFDDSATVARARGRATLKGTVFDDKKRPVANATVYMATADTSVVTNSNGDFILSGMPAGTHAIRTIRIGFAPVNQTVALRTDSVTEIKIISASVNVIGVYSVRADISKGADRAAFENRQKMGFGSFATEKDFVRRIDMYGVLKQFMGLQVDRNGGALRIVTSRAAATRCAPSIFVDGMYSKLDVIDMMRPSDFRAIEVFPNAGTAPAQYLGINSQCGVILFWTKGARW